MHPKSCISSCENVLWISSFALVMNCSANRTMVRSRSREGNLSRSKRWLYIASLQIRSRAFGSRRSRVATSTTTGHPRRPRYHLLLPPHPWYHLNIQQWLVPQQHRPRRWCCSNNSSPCYFLSVFTISSHSLYYSISRWVRIEWMQRYDVMKFQWVELVVQ